MNAEETINSMREILIPHHDELEDNNDVKLQYQSDNATPHTSILFRNFCMEEKLDHTPFGGHPVKEPGGTPANSPDLFPIEYVYNDWTVAVLKQKPQTVGQLIKIANKEWDKISLESIRKKIKLMQKVFPYVARNNGNQYFK